MELMQLEMFVAVVEKGSIKLASEKVFRTQPAISTAIRKLELEVGLALFDRSRRHHYGLTQAGQTMFRFAKRILALRAETMATLKEFSHLRAGQLRIGANESVSLHLLPLLLEAFLKRHSEVVTEVLCQRSGSLLVDLRDRKLDLALVSFKPLGNDLDCRFVTQDQLVLITHPNHALAHRDNVRIRDLRDESLLVMDVSQPPPSQRNVANALVRIKSSLHLTVTNAPVETIKKMVALGVGVGLVPLMSVHAEQSRKELAVLSVSDFRQQRSVWLVRRRSIQSPSTEAFAAVASEFGNRVSSQYESFSPRSSHKLVFKRPA